MEAIASAMPLSAAPRMLHLPIAEERDFPRHPSSGLTLTVHYWLVSFCWVLAALAACSLPWVIDFSLGILGTPYCIGDPARLAARVLGYAHYTVAFYFLFTSKKVRSPRSAALLGAFFALGLVLCCLVYSIGGHSNRIAIMSVGIFFLAHGLRDEVFFYRQRSGKAIADEEYDHVFSMSIRVQLAALALLATFIYPIYIYGFFWVRGHRQFAAALDHMVFSAGIPLPLKMAALAAPQLLISAKIAWTAHCSHPGGLISFLRSHSPLTTVLAFWLGVALTGAVFGTGIILLLILIHFTGWYGFAAQGLAQQSRAAEKRITWRTPTEWFKRTYIGFNVFHGGLIALFAGLILFNHYALAHCSMTIAGHEMENPLSFLFDFKAFPYWTIIHITLAFAPLAEPKRR
jgi:hypothetical protein